MTITFIDLYNGVAEQAWSMFDADAETTEDFESGLKSSINKALSDLWVSYPFPFRVKTTTITTVNGTSSYEMPTGNIVKKSINGDVFYSVRIGKNYLKLVEGIETLDSSFGKPDSFEVYNDVFSLYPTPNDEFEVIVEYLDLSLGENDFGDKLYILKEDNDSLEVGEKYEELFKNALITKAMLYAIADKTDENYSGYEEQYNSAYRNLISYCTGLSGKEKRVIV